MFTKACSLAFTGCIASNKLDFITMTTNNYIKLNDGERRLPRFLKRFNKVTALTALLLASSQTFAACEYVITNDWGSGYTGAIRVSNTGTSAVNGWDLSWAYSGGDRITSSWNVALTGNNPYSGGNISWNGNIQPGQSV